MWQLFALSGLLTLGGALLDKATKQKPPPLPNYMPPPPLYGLKGQVWNPYGSYNKMTKMPGNSNNQYYQSPNINPITPIANSASPTLKKGGMYGIL